MPTKKRTESVENQILLLLKESDAPYPPKDLIDVLKMRTDYSDALIRMAIWELIDHMKIQITDDRKLEVA